MKIESCRDEILGNEMRVAQLSSGMKAYFFPLHNVVNVSMFHLFTRFGSIDARFREPETGKIIEVEDGTAHFLEHCAFYDTDGKDVLEEAAKKGIAANAGTSFDHTTYLFHTTGKNTRKGIEYLISFVTTPYFTDEIVKKEQGVISQEVAMYSDEPTWVLGENARKALFQLHSFRRSLGGDQETIKRITKEYLYSAYSTFYHPSNLNFVVFAPSKDIDRDAKKYFSIAEEICTKKGFAQKQAPEYIYADEPAEVMQKRIECVHKVPEPLVAISYKGIMNVNGGVEERLKADITNDLLAKALFSDSSEAVYELVKKGIARGNAFGGGHTSGRGFGMFNASGSIDNVDRFVEGVTSMIREQVRGGLSRELFEIVKRGCISQTAKALELDPIEHYEGTMISTLAAGYNPMHSMKSLLSVTYEDVIEAGNKYLDTDNYSVSVLLPRK
ncbi:MAG: pitrilysin family protein [Candidatus Nanoarchaeia archaeon]|jgi:predicted Zn-dependent peptidase